MTHSAAAELNPPVRVLLGPGPSDTHPRVLRALAANTVGHLDPYYLELMNGMQQMLRTVMRTQNRMTMAVSATATAHIPASHRAALRAFALSWPSCPAGCRHLSRFTALSGQTRYSRT